MPTIKSPFHAKSTTSDVLSGVDLTGKKILITRGTVGLGRETVGALAAAGAQVQFTVRNVEKGREAVEQINNQTDSRNVAVAELV